MAAMKLDGVRELLRKEVAKAGNAEAWAGQFNITGQYVRDVLIRRKEPGPAILNALRIERVIDYRRIPQRNGEDLGR